jgi:hypothetical protein
VRLEASTKPPIHNLIHEFLINMAFTMACPNFKKGLKMAVGPLGVRASSMQPVYWPHLECQWPNFALVTVICQDLYNFWLLPYFWSGFLMSKFGFYYVYPKCFSMRFQWYKFQVLIINDSKVRESFRGPIYRLHWGCS